MIVVNTGKPSFASCNHFASRAVTVTGISWLSSMMLLLQSLLLLPCSTTAFVETRCHHCHQRTTLPASTELSKPFYSHLPNSRPSRLFSSGGGGKDEADLFDYFDPLLSPHAYPDGISPDNRPQPQDAVSQTKTVPSTSPPKKMGFDLPIKASPNVENSSFPVPTREKPSSSEENDLFAYFDPLLSPHAYPQGISPEKKAVGEKQNIASVIGSRTKRVGILLMDHGSKKPASNARLQALANFYQASMDEKYENGTDSEKQGQTQVIVRAAHMEIAAPSIPDGLKFLLEAGAEEIICHPFFLSPDGRHVSEDIPEIIDGAIQSMGIQIPVKTTAPTGSNIPLMLNAVHTLVVESSEILKE